MAKKVRIISIVSIVVLLLSICLVSCHSSSAENNNYETPNVVLLQIDDLGWTDLGYMGSKFYETPNVDQLASEGLVFTNAYAGAANCAPSRTCLLTGHNTPRHGIYTVNPPDRGHDKTRKLIPAANADSIQPANRTLGHLFKKAGYTTCHIGKWHLSSDARNNGFDVNIAGSHKGNPGKNGYFVPYNVPVEQGPKGEYLTDRLTDEAIDFIAENLDRPFFLHMSYYTVHTPLQGKEEKIGKYELKVGVEGQDNAVYAAMVESMDENVGRILNQLEVLGLEKNTLVVFISDNGGIRAISSQTPLRAGKGSYYEGGIRVPMIMKWPNKIRKGVADEPVVNLDFFPTFSKILDVGFENKILDGRDISSLFEGDTLEKRPLIWHFPIYLQNYKGPVDQARDPLFRTRPGTAIRYGKWKFHKYYENGAVELYDLSKDIGERKNIAEDHPDKVKELLKLLNDWVEETGADIPTEKNPKYDAGFENKRIRNVLERFDDVDY